MVVYNGNWNNREGRREGSDESSYRARVSKPCTKSIYVIYIKFNNAIPLQLYLLLYYFIYREGCTYTPDFLNRLKEACPDARVTTEIGEGGKIIETNCYFITTFLFI